MAVIFHNTMYHSKQAKPMPRDFFVKAMTHDKEGYPHFDKQQLFDIYDRVGEEGFKTDTQRIDKIYDRLGAFYNYR